jgi:hypothetical protein
VADEKPGVGILPCFQIIPDCFPGIFPQSAVNPANRLRYLDPERPDHLAIPINHLIPSEPDNIADPQSSGRHQFQECIIPRQLLARVMRVLKSCSDMNNFPTATLSDLTLWL